MTTWFNYFVTNKFSRLTNGHIESEKLLSKVLEHNGDEAYACYFDLDYSSLKVEYDTGRVDKDEKPIYEYHAQGSECPLPSNGITFTQYEGTCRPAFNCVAFDFDGKSDTDALEDVRKFIAWLDIDDAVVFFSGSKGFHVLIHFDYFNLSIGPDLVLQLKDLAKYLEKHFPTLDSGIYNFNRKFRVPFTRHDKSGLFKSFVNLKDLQVSTMENIRAYAKDHYPFDFLPKKKDREFNPQISEAIEGSKRESYEVEKHRAGSVEKPTKFEGFINKLCIKRALESNCETVGRNNACMVIVNDMLRTGVNRTVAEDKVRKWAYDCGLPEREWVEIFTKYYDRDQRYNFGCQDPVKEAFCSAKCKIWNKLAPEKRPQPLDAPESFHREVEQTKRIPQMEIVGKLLIGYFKCQYDREDMRYLGGNVIDQDENLFYYEDDYWQPFGSEGVKNTKREIQNILGPNCTVSQVKNIYEMFLTWVPVVPRGVDLFTPRRDMVNFSNGVLAVKADKEGKLYKEFTKGHSRVNYLTSKHTLAYQEVINSPDNCQHLMGVLKKLFGGADDIEEIIKAIAMMYGGSLVPMFPMIFHFYGPAKTGKSTIIQILMELLDKRNIAHKQPKEFRGFNLESMVGKLVNCVTDIDIRTPINDDMVKQILDKAPVTVQRKNRTDIIGNIPCMHLFAGNGLPKSFEVSAAHDRRWTFVPCNNVIDDDGSNFATSEDFAKWVYTQEPDGVLQFALWGLDLLIENNGKFIKFNSSKKALEEMRNNSDIVSQFLLEVTTEGVEMDGVKHFWRLDAESKINRALTWKLFNSWQEDSNAGWKNSLAKQTFLSRMAVRGHGYVASNGHWLSGISACDAEIGSESQGLDGI